MPTTSNFGWTTPADTDLVKDGALAIRTLGNGIDTSMAELKGGTTGQVLSKTSNTDMDFTWVTTDDANAIQNAIVDAKGDLIAATANDTPARLAVGNNGETLVADSSATTGLRWTATPSASNPVLNSSYDIWQRGTSFAPAANTATYTADRWQVYTGATGRTISRQTTSDTTNLPAIQYCVRIARDSGNTSTSAIQFTQNFESSNSIPYAGKTVTMSFYARAGANYSAASGALGVTLYTGTGTDQNLYSGYTGSASPINSTATLTTTWQRFSYSGTIAATATEIAPYFIFTPVGTAGAADYAEITGVQIDVGSTALPYRRNSATLAGELAACQRYYYRTSGSAAYYAMAQGVSSSTTAANALFQWPVTLRTASTDITYGNLYFEQYNGTAGTNPTVTAANASNNVARLSLTGMTGLTAGQVGYLFSNNDSTSYIAVNAEL